VKFTRALPVLIESKPGSKSLFYRVFEPDNRTHLSWKRSIWPQLQPYLHLLGSGP